MAAPKRPFATPAAYLERIKKLRGDIEQHTGLELASKIPAGKTVYEEFALHSGGISALVQAHLDYLHSLSQGRFEPVKGTGELRVGLAGKRDTLPKDISALRVEERHASQKYAPQSRLFAPMARRDPMLLEKSIESHDLIFGKVVTLLQQHPELKQAYEAYLQGKIKLR